MCRNSPGNKLLYKTVIKFEGDSLMVDSHNDINYLFEEMVRLGLVSTGSNWVEEAIRTKHPRLSIGIAHSKLLIYDKIDRRIMRFKGGN